MHVLSSLPPPQKSLAGARLDAVVREGSRLTNFAFSYHHESSECCLSARNVDGRVFFHFTVRGAGQRAGREDGVLTTRVSVARIVRDDVVDARTLAAEILLDAYSHGEPQRRKPGPADENLLRESLIAWIRRNR